jgi:hypothetical protein
MQSWKIYLFIVIALVVSYIAVFVWWKSRKNTGWREKFSLGWKKDEENEECSSVSSSDTEDHDHHHDHHHDVAKSLPPPPPSKNKNTATIKSNKKPVVIDTSSSESDSSSDSEDDMYDESLHKNLDEYDARVCTMNAFRRIFNRNATPEEISKYSQLKCTSDIDKAVSTMKFDEVAPVTVKKTKKVVEPKVDEEGTSSDDEGADMARVKISLKKSSIKNCDAQPPKNSKSNVLNKRRQRRDGDDNGKCLNSWYSGAPYTSSASPYTPYDRVPKNIEDDPTASRLLKGLRTIDNSQCMSSQKRLQTNEHGNYLDGFNGLDMFDDYNNVTSVDCSGTKTYKDVPKSNGLKVANRKSSDKNVAIDSVKMLTYLDNICKQVDSAKDLVVLNRSR